jgi:hypothetical protein
LSSLEEQPSVESPIKIAKTRVKMFDFFMITNLIKAKKFRLFYFNLFGIFYLLYNTSSSPYIIDLTCNSNAFD